MTTGPAQSLRIIATLTLAFWCGCATASLDATERANCIALAQVRGLRAPLPEAMLGDKAAFPLIATRAAQLQRTIAAYPGVFAPVAPLTGRIHRNAEQLLSHRDVVMQAHEALRAIRASSPELLTLADAVVKEELVTDGGPARIAASTQLAMISQRLGKSAAELVTLAGVDAESVFMLAKDTKTFTTLARGMLDGDADLRLRPARTAVSKAHLTNLIGRIERTREQVGQVLSPLRYLVAAREAQVQLMEDIDALDRSIEPLCLPRQ